MNAADQGQDKPIRPVDWERIARAHVHPVKVRIIDTFAKSAGPMSAKHISTALGHPLSNIAYHVRVLVASGDLELVRTKPVRGSVEKFYVLK